MNNNTTKPIVSQNLTKKFVEGLHNGAVLVANRYNPDEIYWEVDDNHDLIWSEAKEYQVDQHMSHVFRSKYHYEKWLNDMFDDEPIESDEELDQEIGPDITLRQLRKIEFLTHEMLTELISIRDEGCYEGACFGGFYHFLGTVIECAIFNVGEEELFESHARKLKKFVESVITDEIKFKTKNDKDFDDDGYTFE